MIEWDIQVLTNRVQLVAAQLRERNPCHAAAAQYIDVWTRNPVKVESAQKNAHIKRRVMRCNDAAFQEWLNRRPQLAECWCILHIAVFDSVNLYVDWMKVIGIRFNQVMLCLDDSAAFHDGDPDAARTRVSSVCRFEINRREIQTVHLHKPGPLRPTSFLVERIGADCSACSILPALPCVMQEKHADSAPPVRCAIPSKVYRCSVLWYDGAMRPPGAKHGRHKEENMHAIVPIAFASSSSPSASATASPTSTLNPLSIPPKDWGEALDRWMNQTFSLGIWGTIIYSAIVALIAYVVIKLMQRTLKKKLYGNLHIIYRLLHVIVITLAVVSVLLTITPLKDLGNALVASSGLAGVIVGLAAQETLANLFSGISIAIAKPFVVGDFIEILGTTPMIMGTVTKITFRSTVIRDASNKEIVIPNSVIDQDVIRTAASDPPGEEKFDSTGKRKGEAAPVTNFLDVGVAYTADVKKAMKILAELVAKQPSFVDLRSEQDKAAGAPAVTVRVMDLAASSVNLRAFVPTRTVAEGYSVLSDLRLLVLDTFAQQGIEIPYPYENVIVQQAQSAADNTKSTESH